MSDIKKPIETLRDGSVKAAIWENDSEKGKFHSVTFSRTYRDKEGNYANSSRFSGADLLKLSKIAEQSYDAVQQYRAPQDRNSRSNNYADQQRETAQPSPSRDKGLDR